MGCFCSTEKMTNDVPDQYIHTPSSSSPPPPPQWNSPPRLLITPQPYPPPSWSSRTEQMLNPLCIRTERKASPLPSARRVPTDRRWSLLLRARRVLIEQSTSLLSSPRRIPIKRSTSPLPGPCSLLEPFFEGPSVGASPSSAPSAEMTKQSRNFTFLNLSIATKNFSHANFLGEGGFGNVYKGKLHSGEVVAVKVLRKGGVQGNKEFLTEVLMLTMLKHPNLISLVGFCSEGDQRLLVYEFMPNGTLLDHLSKIDLPPNRQPLDWNTRIKIIVGVANGLHYLHDLADPSIIYCDMKPENILLDNDFNPKLSDFGLTKLAPAGDDAYVITRILENHGYCDPEYVATGKLSKKSDIYSFGILMLELISGRSVYDETAPRLLAWASAFLGNRRLYRQLVDPLLHGCFRRRSLNMLAPVIEICTHREPCLRPPIKDVVKAVATAASFCYDSQPSTPSTTSSQSSASL